MESVSQVSSIAFQRPSSPASTQLSIVVPVSDSARDFEATLLSVLENRPEGCEVLVCHDGSYDDPFDLCDEVQFVTVPSSNPVEMIAESARSANGQVVHILGAGVLATLGWADAAVECFEQPDVGFVTSPVYGTPDQTLVALGWEDSKSRLCIPSRRDHQTLKTADEARPYLTASWWRRDLLTSLVDSITSSDLAEASVAINYLAKSAGWRGETAVDSVLKTDSIELFDQAATFDRGRRLAGIRSYFLRGGSGASIQASLIACFSNLVRPNLFVESLGQALGASAASKLKSRLRAKLVLNQSSANSNAASLQTATFEAIRRAA